MASTEANSMALTLSNPVDSAAASTSAFSVRLNSTDALPYYDRELETQQGLRAKVDQEIAEEQKRMDSLSDDRLPPVYDLFQSRPDLQAELERISSNQPSTSRLDTTRYTLPAPAAELKATEAEWSRSLDNAAAQLGHMQIRLKNVELLRKYGSNLWRLHNFQQESMQQQYADALEPIRSATNEINRTRQAEQTEAGRKLSTLERRWTELISSGLQLEVANITAEHEVEALRIQQEQLQHTLDRLNREEEAGTEDAAAVAA